MIEQKRLTAAEVRALPPGSTVLWHGRDRRGYHTQLECTVVQYGRGKALAYRDVNMLTKTKPIRDLPNRYFTLVKEYEG